MDLYEINPSDLAGLTGAEPEKDKICPGLQRFCPHYTSSTCDVKYSECVLLNTLKTSEALLRAEREKLVKDPTPQNLAFLTQIDDVLQEKNPDLQISPAAITWSRRKGRFVAAVFLVLIVAAAFIMYVS